MPEQKQNKPKIISVYFYPPPYELFAEGPRPAVTWNTSRGKFVGIWDFNFLNLLGNEILKLTQDFTYEVWQADTRADKIYSHTFQNGLIQKVFPATHKKKLYGLKFTNEIYSRPLYEELEKEAASGDIIIHLHSNLLGFNKRILKKINKVPMVFTYHGPFKLPLADFWALTRNFPSKINLILEHLFLKKYINKLKCITYQNNSQLSGLRKIYNGRLEQITMGCDFSFWHKLDKNSCRKELNLPSDKLILLTIARLVSPKQLDKMIRVLSALENKCNFLYLIIGTGARKDAEYLEGIAKPLLEKGKMQFPGYQRGERLLRYLNAADLYLLTSASEGASVAVMEAFACELPVFSTKMGGTAELMEEHNAGCLVGTKNYKEWEEKLSQILETRQLPKILDRNIAKEHYDWRNIAGRFLEIYKKIKS